MSLSIIIPTLNEANYCRPLFEELKKIPFKAEIIVVDGGSSDRTQAIVSEFGFEIYFTDPGRSRQLAHGAQQAKGKHLLFLHADVKLDSRHLIDLKNAIDNGTKLASFPVEFDTRHWFLSLNALFSKLSHPYFHFGDQGLWIDRTVYEACGGYDPEAEILEDQDIYQRACRITKAVKFDTKLKVSARKYREIGVVSLQFQFYKLWLMSKLGYSKRAVAKKYRDFLLSRRPNDT